MAFSSAASARVDLGLLFLDFGRRARNLEPDEHVAPPHTLAGRVRNLRDSRCLGRDDDELGAGAGPTMPVACTTPRMSPRVAGAVFTATAVVGLDFLRRLARDTPRRHRRGTGRQPTTRAMRSASVMEGALRWRARDRRAPSWNCETASSDAQAHVARRLQRLEQRRDAGLTELIGILRQLLDLLRLRQDRVAVAEIRLTLRLGGRRGRRHVAGDPDGCGLTLRHELVERGLLDHDARLVGREHRQRDGDARHAIRR